jgi:hypothetical protein
VEHISQDAVSKAFSDPESEYMEAYSYSVGLTWRSPYGLDNSVDNTATVRGLDGLRFEPRWKKEILSLLYRPNRPCDLSGLVYYCCRGCFPGLWRPASTMTSTSSITVTIKHTQSYNSAILLCLHWKATFVSSLPSAGNLVLMKSTLQCARTQGVSLQETSVLIHAVRFSQCSIPVQGYS